MALILDGTEGITQPTITTAFGVPAGTTAQRPSPPVAGMVRFNTDIESLEFYDGVGWVPTNLIPFVNSVTGTIFVGQTSTLALSLTSATSRVTVRFTEGGVFVADVDDVVVTTGSASVVVPTAVFGQSAGDIIAVSVINQDGTASSNSVNKTVTALPTGGTITTSGNFRIHTFTSSGSFVVPSGSTLSDVEYLVVAGGGQGGLSAAAGGGGAGGYRCSVLGEASGGGASAESRLTLAANTYTVTVGAGGSGGSGVGGSGSDSVFGSITSVGGGGGASVNGLSGGSGGGSGYQSSPTTFAAAGTAGQGFAGGRGGFSGGFFPPGAGGGAGAVGASPTGTGDNAAKNGGVGVSSSINGTAVFRGGGGGAAGSAQGAAAGAGGNGGGGSGSTAGTAGSGGVNTGGGGGGTNTGTAGTGGSGIVIVRYVI